MIGVPMGLPVPNFLTSNGACRFQFIDRPPDRFRRQAGQYRRTLIFGRTGAQQGGDPVECLDTADEAVFVAKNRDFTQPRQSLQPLRTESDGLERFIKAVRRLFGNRCINDTTASRGSRTVITVGSLELAMNGRRSSMGLCDFTTNSREPRSSSGSLALDSR